MDSAVRTYILICLIFSIIFVTRTRRISKTSCSSEAAFYRVASDHALDEEPVSRNVTDDLFQCIDICVELPKCVAINVRQHSKVDCHTLKDDRMSKPNKIIAKKGWSLYDTGTIDISRSVGSRCSLMTIDPCPSHCTCVDTCDSYRCDCYGPEIFRSCREALTAYPGSDQQFWIMPDGTSSAVYASCYKESDSTHLMRIRHNGQARTKSIGYEASYSYKKSFSYPQNTLEDVSAIVDALGSCRQYTIIECHAMVITNIGALKNRDGARMTYIGGGPSHGSGCACGVTGTCYQSTTKCNCDANVYTGLKDEGSVTTTADLPLTGIELGDTGNSNEYGYYTIGPLECFDTFTSCGDAASKYSTGGPYYWIKAAGAANAVYTKCA